MTKTLAAAALILFAIPLALSLVALKIAGVGPVATWETLNHA